MPKGKKFNGRKSIGGRKFGKRRNGGNGGGRRGPRGMRTNAAAVLGQGVGAINNLPFGSRVGTDLRCWDAKLPMHLPLPRAIGPYLVMRTTKRYHSFKRAQVFGTFKYTNVGAHFTSNWSTICGCHDVIASDPIVGPSNTLTTCMPMDGLGAACTVVPSAFSVQIMNPGAIGETSGMVYAGVMNTQAAISGRTESWDDYFDKFIEFQSPRIMSAGKLAIRGVQINSYPLNMNALSDFTTIQQDTSGVVTWSPNGAVPCGFAPILVYNNNVPALGLEFLVTTEWRVRFDLDHPASSAHRQYPVATDHLWANLMSKATALGNGVMDISDVVSNIGNAWQKVAKFRPLLALGA